MKPVLDTPRLTLMPFESTDLNLLYKTLTNPYVRMYLLDDEVISLDKAKEFIRLNEQSFTEEGWGLWKLLVKEDGTYAGFAGLWCFFNEKQPQLLYALLPHQAGEGYATEASRTIIGYAFDTLSYLYLLASCNTPNQASRNVCVRLGMKQINEREVEGHMTTFYRLDR